MSNVRDFGAAGDGRTDDTKAIRHAVRDGDGLLEFPRGVYRVTSTIEIPLDKVGCTGISGSAGTAKLLMAGKGPAIRLVGTHGGTGDPSSVKPNVWRSQRLPTIQNIEIHGAHPEADGVELIETMQSVFEGVLIHDVRDGIRLHRRNRNVLISHCHIYNNRGVGVFLDRVNLHQINIASNHISYNRLGGIRIQGSEVRNLQITGNDIEYNNHRAHKTKPEPTAEIYVDTTAEGASVNEVTVASNTIQATVSAGGCNIRILNKNGQGRRPGLWTISGNIIGSQENNVHLTGCHGIVLSGNFIYSGGSRNLLVEDSSQINVTGNSFRRHAESMFTGLRFVSSQDCVVSGCTVQDEHVEGQPTGASLLELHKCRRFNVTGCQFLDGVPYGVDVSEGELININGCTVQDTRASRRSRGAIRFRGPGTRNLLTGNTIGDEGRAGLDLDPRSGVALANNLQDG